MIWWTKSWNPVIGCTKCSPACDNCYAEALHAQRHKAKLAGAPMALCYAEPFDKVRFLSERLSQPLHWRKPQRVFVGNMGDLFHEGVSFEWLDRIFAVMALSPQHTFMLLTKRPERMREYMLLPTPTLGKNTDAAYREPIRWPLPNVWLGTTIWDQPSADRAVPPLLSIPAAKRFVSVEPMLGPVDLRISNQGGTYDSLTGRVQDVPGLRGCGLYPALDWVICGGETGPGARPMHPDWPRKVRDDCVAAGVPFFFKQWGEFRQKGGFHVFEFRCSGTVNIGWPDGTIATGTEEEHGGLGFMLPRVGKAKAGRVLDGRTWEEVPNAR